MISSELRENRRINQIRLWKDPVYRSNQMQKRADAEWRAQLKALTIAGVNQPGVKEKWNASFSLYLQKPGTLAQIILRSTAAANKPEERAKRRLLTLCLWQTAEYRQKQKQARDSDEWRSDASVRGREIGARPLTKRRRIEKLQIVMKGKGMGHIVTTATRIAISKGNKGKQRTFETRERMRIARLGKKLLEETKDKIATKTRERILKGICWKQGLFISAKAGRELFYQSSYELELFKLLEIDKGVADFQRCPFMIDYTFDNRLHKYIPDVLVEFVDGMTIVIEVKAKGFVDDPVNVTKFKAAEDFCDQKDWKFLVVTETELFGDSKNQYSIKGGENES